jgi:hypothetical protein
MIGFGLDEIVEVRVCPMSDSLLEQITEPAATARRLWRYTIVIAIAAVLGSALFAGARFTLGVGLGGALALVNYAWLRGSLRGILATGSEKMPPGARMKLIFRWLVVATVAYLANQAGYFEAIGIVIGLLAFAGAAIIEAVYLVLRITVPRLIGSTEKPA